MRTRSACRSSSGAGASPAAAERAAAAVPDLRSSKTPEELAARSDVLSVHLALTAETRGLVNQAIFDG